MPKSQRKLQCDKCGNWFVTKGGNYNKHINKCSGEYKPFVKGTSCKHCGLDFAEDLSTSVRANHTRWCLQNPKRDLYRMNTKGVDAMADARKETGFHNQFSKARVLGLPIPESPNKGKSYEGRPHTDEAKEKIREAALNSNHRRLRKGVISYNGVTLDSSWELKLAQRLDHLGVQWERPDPIKWVDKNGLTHNYFPDFFLSDYGVYLDPKNKYAYESQKEKWEVLLSSRNDIILLMTLQECIDFDPETFNEDP